MKKADSTILLIVPPFASIDFPMIGPSLLAASCKELGLDVMVLYANMQLATKIGYSLYQRISVSSFSLMAGELLFRNAAFPGEFRGVGSTLDAFFITNEAISVSSPMAAPIAAEELTPCIKIIEDFLFELGEQIKALDPKVIGISSVFQQNLASIAIARMVKTNDPEKIIVLGGANASSPMGEALAESVDSFDYIFSGEADIEFAQFCKTYIEDGELPRQKLIECIPLKDMDQIPYPDYADYFSQVAGFQKRQLLPLQLPSKLPLETSRGCWWGQKYHCTFCGLNGKEISFRNKSGKRVLEEIDYLGDLYNIHSFQATDNIMPYSFKKDVLPVLSEKRRKSSFFYEVKSNLKEDELDLFCKAGIDIIQPGIESFSSHILELISKGVKGIHNIWLLRECLSRQIQVVWNILAAIPGDREKDYHDMRNLVPKISHLHPPQGVSRIIIDRYSPYHSFPGKYGIESLSPLPSYYQLYPRQVRINDLAYHFCGTYDTVFNNIELAKSFKACIENNWIKKWTEGSLPPKLYAVSLDGGRYFIEDTRDCAIEQRIILNNEATLLLKFLRTPRKLSSLEDLKSLPDLIFREYVIFHEDYCMSVVVEPEIGFALRKQKVSEAEF